MSNKKIIILIIIINIMTLIVCKMLLSKVLYENQQMEYVSIKHTNKFEDLKYKTIQKFENPYLFLDDEVSEYIISICNEFNVNQNFAVALLNTENPKFNPLAKSKKNKNKSRDLGLWQLNDRYLDWYQSKYWDNEVEFDVYNWKHNTYIAIRYISSLSDLFDENLWYVAAAYNCGPNTVIKEYKNGLKKIPYSTRNIYVPSVINYMKILENNQKF